MAEIQHFSNVSFVSGHIRCSISFDRISESFIRAQRFLGERVLLDCKARMPLLTGSLQQRSYTTDEGRQVIFPGPYGRFQYMGVVMVDPDTGSPFARPGVKKVVTDRKLTYSRAEATAQWFETAKAEHGADWIAQVKRIAGGRNG